MYWTHNHNHCTLPPPPPEGGQTSKLHTPYTPYLPSPSPTQPPPQPSASHAPQSQTSLARPTCPTAAPCGALRLQAAPNSVLRGRGARSRTTPAWPGLGKCEKLHIVCSTWVRGVRLGVCARPMSGGGGWRGFISMGGLAGGGDCVVRATSP